MKNSILAASVVAGLLAAGGAALAGPPEHGPGGRHAHEDGRGPGPMGPMGGRGGPGRVDFVAIDADGDGQLSRAELQARAVERIARFDLNGDGALDRAELIAAFPARDEMVAIFAPDPGAEMADRVLAMTGSTADGRVTVVELAEARVNMLLTQRDDDRNDALSADEAAGGPRRGDRGEDWGRP